MLCFQWKFFMITFEHENANFYVFESFQTDKTDESVDSSLKNTK